MYVPAGEVRIHLVMSPNTMAPRLVILPKRSKRSIPFPSISFPRPFIRYHSPASTSNELIPPCASGTGGLMRGVVAHGAEPGPVRGAHAQLRHPRQPAGMCPCPHVPVIIHTRQYVCTDFPPNSTHNCVTRDNLLVCAQYHYLSTFVRISVHLGISPNSTP